MYWKTFTVLVVAAAMTVSCTDYQDEIDALDGRVSYLESLVVRVNADILTLQDVVDAMDQGDYITGVKETPEGYVISFNNASPIFVHHGTDGKDAQVPAISIAKDPNDGNYYWTLDGQWITDPTTGERVRSNGKDGRDGTSPQVRINDAGMWEISTDGGSTWTPTDTSVHGKDGKDANGIVTIITHWNDGYVEFVTENGSFIVPLYYIK